jgi:hypothetical protein
MAEVLQMEAPLLYDHILIFDLLNVVGRRDCFRSRQLTVGVNPIASSELAISVAFSWDSLTLITCSGQPCQAYMPANNQTTV